MTFPHPEKGKAVPQHHKPLVVLLVAPAVVSGLGWAQSVLCVRHCQGWLGAL